MERQIMSDKLIDDMYVAGKVLYDPCDRRWYRLLPSGWIGASFDLKEGR
jgi:hypothetical protein